MTADELRVVDGWHVVAADVDWLADVGGRDPFGSLVPLPALGPNAVHPEVVIAARAAALTTIADGVVRVVQGERPDLGRLAPDGQPSGRLVTFRYAA